MITTRPGNTKKACVMSDGIDRNDGPASFPDQGRDSFPCFRSPPSQRRLFLQGMMGVALLSHPLAVFAASKAPSRQRFFSEHPWLQAWVERGLFESDRLYDLLARIKPDKRVVKWMNHQAEAKPYNQYRTLFISENRIKGGKNRLKRYAKTLQAVEEKYQVPAEVVVALWGIESSYGKNTGGFSVLRTLFTLSTGYPRRASFFRTQLRHFLLLCQEEGFAPHTLKGSYAGAMGQAQMIPETMRRYAVDFDGDGRRDIFHTPVDVLASIASFLAGHGWKAGERYTLLPVQTPNLKNLVSPSLDKMKPWHWWQAQQVQLPEGVSPPDPNQSVGLVRLKEKNGLRYHLVFTNFRVITRWNRSSRFAMVVHELAEQIRV
ncbi:MAG: lytic murein transglycosylase [Magnetococcales bacterium]|nr:lytic murein transglycosylase [Magnetococcales bacterium]